MIVIALRVWLKLGPSTESKFGALSVDGNPTFSQNFFQPAESSSSPCLTLTILPKSLLRSGLQLCQIVSPAFVDVAFAAAKRMVA